MWDKRADILSVHDGDTITAILDQGFGDTKTMAIRLQDVYAPELSQTGGDDTRDFVKAWVARNQTKAWPFIVITERTQSDVHEIESFDRYVCKVYSADMLECLNTDVQKYVTARGYPGGIGS